MPHLSRLLDLHGWVGWPVAHREDIDIQLFVARDLVTGHLGREAREGGREGKREGGEKRRELEERDMREEGREEERAGRRGEGERREEEEGQERKGGEGDRERERGGGGQREEDTAAHFFEADHHFSGELHVFEHPLQFAGVIGTAL